jgi:small subunit ribosomal protein S7
MSRKGSITKREILPDPLYKSVMVAKLINYVLKKGKKSVAESIVYGALQIIENKLKRPALESFLEAVEAARPNVEVRSRRIGGATYQVPTEVREARSVMLGLRWMISSAAKRSERGMAARLAGEMMDALAGKGGALKIKDEKRKMAEANKAFSHYRW